MLATESQVRLGALLRRLREARGLTLRAAGVDNGMSESTMSRVETGKRRLTRDDVDVFLALYAATEEERRAATALLVATSRDVLEWLVPYRPWMSGSYIEYVQLESTARRITEYTPMGIPGLAQTEKYARALTGATSGGDDEVVETFVEFRMRRQRQLAESPPEVRWIITEAGLRIDVGGPHVMKDQLRNLVDCARFSGNVSLYVIPFSTAVRAALYSGFTLFDFSGERDRSVVHDEGTVASAIATEDLGFVKRAEGHVRRLLQAALDPEQSIRYIEEHCARWEEHD